ncbi:MAG TPA: NfeD family protein [Planctomycetaceae bacterium]|nr:NfeD family protein [Planctomycetaceae bacterium]
MDNYAVFALLLLIAGVAVLVTEVFVPSGGILAIITTCLLVSSLFCAYAAWYDTMPFVFWGFVGLVVLAVPTSLGSAFYILPQTTAGKRALLEAPDLAAVEPFPGETVRLRKLIGQFGTTLSLLNPGGLVVVNQERLHATSEGLIIDPKTSVEIIDVRGHRIVVRPGQPSVIPIDPLTQSAPAEATSAPSTGSAPPPIDFEMAAE